MNRTYKMARPRAGIKGTVIDEYVDGRAETCVLHLPDGTPAEVLSDVTFALQHAAQQGREDRSGEILGDAGVTRAAAEVDKHEAEVHMSGLTCSCGRLQPDPKCSTEKWNTHLAYEILQAAARTP